MTIQQKKELLEKLKGKRCLISYKDHNDNIQRLPQVKILQLDKVNYFDVIYDVVIISFGKFTNHINLSRIIEIKEYKF
jgi:hypothetical protein